MGKSTALQAAFLQLLFNGTPIANIADNAASAPLTNLYLSLHTADPTAAGNQATSEVSYTGYTRIPIARTTGGWTVASGNPSSVSPNSLINFPIGTAGSGTATYAGIGTSASGPGELLYSGPITPSIICGNGITPELTTSSTITES